MCFSSKPKVPKPSTQQAAPQPILLEAPKGIEYGDGADDSTDTADNKKPDLKVDKKPTTGEGTQSATATDTGASKPVKSTASSSINRALKRSK